MCLQITLGSGYYTKKNTESDSVGQGVRYCICNKTPGDDQVAGPGAQIELHKVKETCSLDSAQFLCPSPPQNMTIFSRSVGTDTKTMERR